MTTRYRVRGGSQTWNAKGPDLLRPRALARRKLAGMLVDKPPRMFTKIGEQDWREAGGRAAVMEVWDKFKGREFKVGLKKGRQIEVIAATLAVDVRNMDIPNCSPGTSLAWSLVRTQFPDVIFAGGYVWKETSPGEWSDHAWGTAFDATQKPPKVTNDKVTDWIARMAAAGCLSFDYALGSRRGQVVQVDPDGDVFPSRADKGHLWHVHMSVTDHDGRKPPRTGGF